MDHLVAMDQLREGIGLRGYAQRDPMVEYKREGHERFEVLVSKMYMSISEKLEAAVNVEDVDKVVKSTSPQARAVDVSYKHGELESGVADEAQQKKTVELDTGKTVKVEQVVSGQEKVGRNDPCPCGSGKKYKKCHGR
jgi:preprotein translocase subunit SecA